MMQEDYHAVVQSCPEGVRVDVIKAKRPERVDHSIIFNESGNHDEPPILPDAKTRAIEYAKMKYSSWSWNG